MRDEKQAREWWCQNVEKARQDLNNTQLMEVTIVAGLLNVLRIEYEGCEIKNEKDQDSPIDVHFREACFQLTECLDEDRRRDAELCGKQEMPVSGSLTARTPKGYFHLILSCSQKKLKKYRRVDGDIDLLVYINQRSTYLSPVEPWPCSAPLRKHGWRSVTFVDNYSYARVLYANDDAPDFLREAVGKTHVCKNGPGRRSVFPQTLGPQ